MIMCQVSTPRVRAVCSSAHQLILASPEIPTAPGNFFSCPFLSPLYPEFFYLQHPRITVADAGFEPGTSASEVWCAVNQPPHIRAILFLFRKALVTDVSKK